MVVQHANLEQSEPVGPQMHRLLRERIIRGELIPGARLSETEVALHYSISRQPVREAFIKLAEEGLVEVRPQRGTFVTRISVPKVLTTRFIREAVEADVMRSLAGTITPAMLLHLDKCLEEQEALEGAESGADFMRLDEAFHRSMMVFFGNAAVGDYLEGLKIHLNRVRYLSAKHLPRQKLLLQHRRLVDALRRKDASEAEAAIREHLREIIIDLPGVVALHPEFFVGHDSLEGLK